MKKVFGVYVGLIIALAIGLSACATNQKKPTVEKSRLVTITATVEAIDLANRMVTLKKSQGDSMTIRVDDRVKNLPQVQVGDQVVANYYESIAFRVMKPGETAVASDNTVVEKAKPGKKPSGIEARQITVTASIEAIDKDNSTVTFKGPKGNLVTVVAEDANNLEKVKVGDNVEITYTEALAVDVAKAKK
jgi:hypothetical protein